MIVVMNPGAKEEEINEVVSKLKELDFGIHISRGEQRTIIGAIGDRKRALSLALEAMACVEKIVLITQPFKLVSREFKTENTVIKIKGVEIGGEQLVVMAGPCAVESREQYLEAADLVAAAGAKILRGGAFKPRTSPYSFQGLEEEGLKILAEAGEKTGLPVVTEVMDQHTVSLVAAYADILQVGARNMQNFQLLKALGRTNKPVLLKRGMSATIEEWLMAAEYILSEGNHQVIFCERGIRTFETFTRNTLDLSSVPVVKQLSHLPVITDPSHGTGHWRYVDAMSKASLAAGADGLIIEVHPHPAEALSDGPQSLNPANFANLMEELKKLAQPLGRTL